MRFLEVSVIFLVILLVGTIGIQQSFGEESENISIIERNGFKFSVQTDKFHYDEKEPIAIKWKVENVGSNDIEYLKRSTCHEGFSFSVFDSEENKIEPLTSKAFLIKENDPIIGKFRIEFYAQILEEIQNEPTKEHGIIIFTTDKDATEKVLLKLGITKIYKSEFLGFMTARVTAVEIPKIANYDFVTSIGDGELPVCGMAELTGVLHSQESLEGSFEWSQLIPSSNRDEAPRQVPDGFYSIEVEFNWMYNCLSVALGDTESTNEIPKFNCGMERVVSGFSDEEKVRYFEISGFSENAIIDPVTHFLIEPSDLQSDDSSLFEKDFYLDELERDKFSSSVSDFPEISATAEGGKVRSIQKYPDANSLIISIDIHEDGFVYLEIPKETWNWSNSKCESQDPFILVDGEEVWDKNGDVYQDRGNSKNGYTQTIGEFVRYMKIDVPIGTEAIEIISTGGFNTSTQAYGKFCAMKDKGVFLPPLKQVDVGFLKKDVICKENMILVFKTANGSPACLKPSSIEELVKREWAMRI